MSKHRKVGAVIPTDDIFAVLQLVTLWPVDLLEFKVMALVEAKLLMASRVNDESPITGIRVNYPLVEKTTAEAKKELERIEKHKLKKAELKEKKRLARFEKRQQKKKGGAK